MSELNFEFSPFCHLDHQGRAALEQIVHDMEAIEASFEQQGSFGRAALHTLAERKLPSLIADPSLLVAEQDKVTLDAVRQRFQSQDDLLRELWDTCSMVCDHALAYSKLQPKVQALLVEASSRIPEPQSIHRWRAAATLPLETRELMNELYKPMHEFAVTPFQQVYDTYAPQLATLSKPIAELCKQKEVFLNEVSHLSGKEIVRWDQHLTTAHRQLRIQLLQMDEQLHTYIESAPNFDHVSELLQKSTDKERLR